LLARQQRKRFLHRIVAGDKKRIYFDNPKRRKSCDPGQFSTLTPKRQKYPRKKNNALYWWDQKGVVYHEVLKSGQTITGDFYREQIIVCAKHYTKNDQNIKRDSIK